MPVISFCLASISFQLKKPQRSRSWRPKRHAATQQQQQFCSAALHAFVFFYFSNFALRWQENESKAKKEERQRDSVKAMGKDKAIKQVWKTQTPTRNWWELWDYIERGIKWNAYRIPLGERTCYCLARLFMSLSLLLSAAANQRRICSIGNERFRFQCFSLSVSLSVCLFVCLSVLGQTNINKLENE